MNSPLASIYREVFNTFYWIIKKNIMRQKKLSQKDRQSKMQQRRQHDNQETCIGKL